MSLNLDTTHSNLEFSVRHMGLCTVKGRFNEFAVDAEVAEDGTPRKVRVEIDTASIDTGTADRDAHLRSADFFDVEKHPKIVFESTSFREDGPDYLVDGTLTMNGVTKPATFRAEISGPVKDPWGNDRFAAELEGRLDRREFGLTWNQVLEAGSLLVSEQVRFTAAIQLVRSPKTVEEAATA